MSHDVTCGFEGAEEVCSRLERVGAEGRIIVRRLLPIAFVAAVVVAALRMAGRTDQLLGAEARTALVAVAVLIVLSVFLLRSIRGYARVQAALEAQLRQAQKMEAVGLFAGGIAHDFNNLLTAIAGYSVEALEGATSERQRGQLREIQRTADRGGALIRQLLAFTRPGSREPSVFDLNDVVEGLGQLLQRLLGGCVEVRTTCDPSISGIKAARAQIEQVIVNLAVNARDAMPHGGVLELRTSEVELNDRGSGFVLAPPPGRYVRLVVQDNGIGVDERVRGRIFEPFVTTKDRDGGTGLGLAIVRGILEQSGGGIALESKHGEGTSFELFFPVAAKR
jgi:two-component system cell cycle sensor histidine kinase/response regulator CckA